MKTETRSYMRWAKLHQKVRYDLTISDIPGAELTDIQATTSNVSLKVDGAYGHPQLISAIAQRYEFHEEGVVPVPGASSGNFIALAVAGRSGQTILLEQPVYEPIERAAAFMGFNTILLHRRPESGFAVDPKEVEIGLSNGASAVVLTNLHNPSGQCLSRGTVEEIADRCEHAGATLIVDEAYLDGAHLVAGGPMWTAANVSSNVIVTSTLTKVYGLGGLRAGWILAHDEMADRAREMMDILSVCNAAPAASLAVRAFECISHLEKRYRDCHKQGQLIFQSWIENEPLVRRYDNHGALFECVGLPPGVTGDRLNDLLAGEYDTQVTPGSFFGLPDHIRLSITHPPDQQTEALSRISKALATLVV